MRGNRVCLQRTEDSGKQQEGRQQGGQGRASLLFVPLPPWAVAGQSAPAPPHSATGSGPAAQTQGLALLSVPVWPDWALHFSVFPTPCCEVRVDEIPLRLCLGDTRYLLVVVPLIR